MIYIEHGCVSIDQDLVSSPYLQLKRCSYTNSIFRKKIYKVTMAPKQMFLKTLEFCELFHDGLMRIKSVMKESGRIEM